MAVNKELLKIPITFSAEPQRISDTLSIVSCRIFYKYENRNGGYISDSFAKKLLETLPYTPLKGIFNTEDGEFTDHGESRDMGKIYGVVPESPYVRWEDHVDEDGIMRSYACCDVLLFSALYKDINDIVGKPQSMELYEPSIKGSFQMINGKKLFKFEEGSFLGLQVLGKNVEPCFEGSSFFTEEANFAKVYSLVEEMTSIYKAWQNTNREVTNMKLNKLEQEVATEFEVEGAEETAAVGDEAIVNETAGAEVVINGIIDEEAAADLENSTPPDTEVFSIEVDATEKDAYEQLKSGYESFSNLLKVISEFQTKIEEATLAFTTLKAERDEISASHALTQEENNELKAFKLKVEAQNKEAIIATYTELLDEAILDGYKNKLDEYSALSLDKELAYELKQNNLATYTKEESYIPKDEPISGLVDILNKYK